MTLTAPAAIAIGIGLITVGLILWSAAGFLAGACDDCAGTADCPCADGRTDPEQCTCGPTDPDWWLDSHTLNDTPKDAR